MKIKIPYNKRELTADNKIIDNRGKIEADIDMTILAEEKWEAHFPKQAEKETVFSYVERLNKTPQTPANAAAIILSSVKALYCFLRSDDLPDFKSFASLFDLADAETVNKQIKVIKDAFDAVLAGSMVNPKN